MFTRKHYAAVAEVIAAEKEHASLMELNAVHRMADAFADMFAENSEWFRRDLFIEAANAGSLLGVR